MTAAQNFVDLRVAVTRHDEILDSKISEVTQHLGAIDNNCEQIQKENEALNALVQKSSTMKQVTSDNVTEFVHPADAISEKLIKLQAKIEALNECRAMIKKAYSKDMINLKKMLEMVRTISKKQCKTIQKINKLIGGAQAAPMPGQMMPGQMPAYPQQPGYPQQRY
jgi:uncharacterized coiled-coil DUF342 family protein